TTDDYDALTLSGDALVLAERLAGDYFVLLGQELHREVNALELAARHRQVTRDGGADAQQDGVELLAQNVDSEVAADVDAGPEDHAFVLHLLHPALDDVLLDLEVRDAQAQQAADVVLALKDRHRVAGTVDLLRRGEARGPRA